MQTPSASRHGKGWRGYWREAGKMRTTAVYPKKSDAQAAVQVELDRLRLGAAYRAPITLQELSDRWLAVYDSVSASDGDLSVTRWNPRSV
jgi:hypothetical protein